MNSHEIVVLQHHLTEQTLAVPLATYRQEARAKFKHWQIKGQAQFLMPAALPALSPMPPLPRHPNRSKEDSSYHAQCS